MPLLCLPSVKQALELFARACVLALQKRRSNQPPSQTGYCHRLPDLLHDLSPYKDRATIMNHLAKFSDSSTNLAQMSYQHMLTLLLNAVCIGLVLVLTTFLEMKYLSGYESQFVTDSEDEEDEDEGGGSPVRMKPKKGSKDETLQQFLGASNLLFLCVGLTGLMLLVNDNLARAFAIAAAIALVRFRVKLDQKSINASLLFAILAGMACGLNAIQLAWTATGIYIALFVLLLIIVQFIKPKAAKPAVGTPPRAS